METTFETRTTCRSCGSDKLRLVLDLGKQPLANSLLGEDADFAHEPKYPLTLVWCEECKLVQIKETVAPKKMFEHYLYFSSVSKGVVDNGADAVDSALQFMLPENVHQVVELASNDGYLLKNYQKRGVKVLGIDPAENIAKVANEAGVPTRAAFFTNQLAHQLRDLENVRADVIHANNVLAHVWDQNDFVKGIATLLRPGGVAVIEVPYLGNMIQNVEFDTIYHEHLCYFSVMALETLFLNNGMFIKDVVKIPIHGGSLRLFVQHNTHGNGYSSVRVRNMVDNETRLGMQSWSYYSDYARRVDDMCDSLQKMVSALSFAGHKIWAYGAAAKGSTLLNFPRLNGLAFHIDVVVDKSPHKQGLLMPGVHIPIVPPADLQNGDPDYLLVLAWNFKGEISRELQGYMPRTKLLVPVPRVEILHEPLPLSAV